MTSSATTPGRDAVPLYDAAMAWQQQGTPLMILAGKEYGTGSSRDWAAKGVALLGVKAVIAESFERIHRSNLVGMGVLPLEFTGGATRQSLALTGFETITIDGLDDTLSPRATLTVRAVRADGSVNTFEARCRIDTPEELNYYKNGGILHYVLRQLAAKGRAGDRPVMRNGPGARCVSGPSSTNRESGYRRAVSVSWSDHTCTSASPFAFSPYETTLLPPMK
jgi:aconitate hydratase